MDQATQANAMQTAEISATSQPLATQAQQRRELVGRFKLGGDRSRERAMEPGAGTPSSPTGSAMRAPRRAPSVEPELVGV